MSTAPTNWATNLTYHAAQFHEPQSVPELQEIVLRSSMVKPLGTGHSFNEVADTTGVMISLKHLNQVVAIAPEKQTATVQAGIRYGELCADLHAHGFALHNLASLPHISVAGAVATATHGSGVRNGNLATAVTALEMVTADGKVVVISPETVGETFYGVVVGLGALGIVTQLTLRIEPTYNVRQVVYENLPQASLTVHFAEIMASAYSVSLFTDWQESPLRWQVWRKHRTDENADFSAEWLEATMATASRHPLTTGNAIYCTEQGETAGAWYERLPHFRLDFTPSNGEELQSEYFVAFADAIPALEAIATLQDQIRPLIYVSEIRAIAADNLWLSPCYQRDSIGIHFTWRKSEEAVSQLLPLLEEKLAPFAPRPHWGKLFTLRPQDLQARYPRISDFQALRHQYDPDAKLQNPFLQQYL